MSLPTLVLITRGFALIRNIEHVLKEFWLAAENGREEWIRADYRFACVYSPLDPSNFLQCHGTLPQSNYITFSRISWSESIIIFANLAVFKSGTAFDKNIAQTPAKFDTTEQNDIGSVPIFKVQVLSHVFPCCFAPCEQIRKPGRVELSLNLTGNIPATLNRSRCFGYKLFYYYLEVNHAREIERREREEENTKSYLLTALQLYLQGQEKRHSGHMHLNIVHWCDLRSLPILLAMRK